MIALGKRGALALGSEERKGSLHTRGEATQTAKTYATAENECQGAWSQVRRLRLPVQVRRSLAAQGGVFALMLLRVRTANRQ